MRLRIFLLLAFFSVPLLAETLETPPNIRVTDQEGRSFPLHELSGTPLLVSFVYSHCPMPNMCPLTMRLTRQLVNELKHRKLTGKLNQLLVTLDPEKDGPAELKDLARRFRVDLRYVRLVTASPQDLKTFQNAMLILGEKHGDLIAHNLRTVLLNEELKPIADFEDNRWTPPQVIGALLHPPARQLAASAKEKH